MDDLKGKTLNKTFGIITTDPVLEGKNSHILPTGQWYAPSSVNYSACSSYSAYPAYSTLYCTILDYLGLSWTISDYLGLSRTISDYLGQSRTISDYLGLSRTILGYL